MLLQTSIDINNYLDWFTSNWLSLLCGFALGIPASIIASYFWENLKIRKTRKDLKKLEGFWLEYIPSCDVENPSRGFSVAEFYYSKEEKCFKYDGSNYKLDSNKRYVRNESWKSVVVSFDNKEGQINYFYRITSVDEPNISRFGHGTIQISRKETTFESGYFLNTKSSNPTITTPIVRSVKYYRFSSFCKGHLNLNDKIYEDFLSKNNGIEELINKLHDVKKLIS